MNFHIYSIIDATMSHLNDIYVLICELESEIMDKDVFAQIYEANLNNQNIHYILAIEGSKVIGFASLHIQQLLHHCANIAELQELVVSNMKQGQGVGRALFHYAKEIAISKNCVQLEVCCNQKRKLSHTFYLQQGMNPSHFKFTLKL